MSNALEHRRDDVVVTRNVLKTFGGKAEEAMAAVRQENLSKAEVLERFGAVVGGLKPEDLRAMRADKIGMVFQNLALLPNRTVRDNVALSLELRNIDA